MVSISRAWHNGSYTMAAKPIKLFELHNTMIQFLIMIVIIRSCLTSYIKPFVYLSIVIRLEYLGHFE